MSVARSFSRARAARCTKWTARRIPSTARLTAAFASATANVETTCVSRCLRPAKVTTNACRFSSRSAWSGCAGNARSMPIVLLNPIAASRACVHRLARATSNAPCSTPAKRATASRSAAAAIANAPSCAKTSEHGVATVPARCRANATSIARADRARTRFRFVKPGSACSSAANRTRNAACCWGWRRPRIALARFVVDEALVNAGQSRRTT